jgi:hypothetical protein
MDCKEFTSLRKNLNKTQAQLSELLGISIKTIQSYEQGWREIPPHAERQILFLVSRKKRIQAENQNCWAIKDCPPEQKKSCPAFEFQSGDLCWFINGTRCNGRPTNDWSEKIEMCRGCEAFKQYLF